MMFNVPQFINVEDKIVGPLTAKQLGWIFLGGVIVMLLYVFLDTQTFYIASIPVLALALALAFYRPYGQPLIALIGAMFSYIFRPRMYVWKKLTEKIEISHASRKAVSKKITSKKTSLEDFSRISESLDINRKA